ncbi:MAG: hypothetical protein PHW73_01310 [Atribacterota bacterium]|nr:hypothetical protein [Atribacterota bacterium]
MAKKKKAIKKISKPLKRVAKYIGNKEIYIPNFKKIVKKNDLVLEMSLEEAKTRRDFTIVNKKEN